MKMKKVLWKYVGNIERGFIAIIYITFVNLISEDMFEQRELGFQMTQFPIELQILS